MAISNALAFFWISHAVCRAWAQRLLVILIAGMLVVSPDFTNVLWLGLSAFLTTVLLFIPVIAYARK